MRGKKKTAGGVRFFTSKYDFGRFKGTVESNRKIIEAN